MSILNLILAMIIYCFIGGLVATITVLIGEECVKDFDNCAILLLCLAWPSFIPIYIMKTIIAILSNLKKVEQMANPNTKVGYWKRNIETLSPRIIEGKVFNPTIQRGYICSNCGKHEWSPKETCSGCGADMCKHEIDVR